MLFAANIYKNEFDQQCVSKKYNQQTNIYLDNNRPDIKFAKIY